MGLHDWGSAQTEPARVDEGATAADNGRGLIGDGQGCSDRIASPGTGKTKFG